MTIFRTGLLFFLSALSLFSWAGTPVKSTHAGYYQNLPIALPEVKTPVFPARTVSIVDFGGVGNGTTLNTEAFERAMTELSRKGGGTLEVPFGVWLTGPIVFRSNINLHLSKGALILFTPNLDAYPIVRTSFEGVEALRCQSPVSGRNLDNIAITGEGSINGSGQAWRPVKRAKLTELAWKELVRGGGFLKNPSYWFPTESSLRGELHFTGEKPITLDAEGQKSIHDYLRPVMVSFIECRNIWLQGVLFENSPGWNIHPLLCENLLVDGVTIRNPAYAQNGDGLDIESCKNVLVVNSLLDVGDDALCLKSGKDEEGRRRGRPTENVLISGCTVFSGHGGFVVGSEMSGGVRNVCVRDCYFNGTDVGLRFKSTRGRGGVVENIYVERISMNNIKMDSFLFDLYYSSKSKSTDPVPAADESTPVFRNIHVTDLVSRNAGRALLFNGLPEMKITNIHMDNLSITAKESGLISESKGIRMNNVRILANDGGSLRLNNASDIQLDGKMVSDTTKVLDLTKTVKR